MNYIKSITIVIFSLVVLTGCKEFNKKNQTESTIELLKEEDDVLSVMRKYKDALQNLTTEGTFELFYNESKVYEQGGVEGTYKNYIEHHLGPELGHFKSFTFSDYGIEAEVDLPYAFTTEKYIYTIITNPDENGNSRTISRKGVAT